MTLNTCDPKTSDSSGRCQASWDGQTLRLDAGTIQRQWASTPYGLRCNALSTHVNNQSNTWVDHTNAAQSDFTLPSHGLSLLAIDQVLIGQGNDNNYTSNYLEIIIDYAGEYGTCRQTIWAWHNIGIRIAFELQMHQGKQEQHLALLEQLQLKHEPNQALLWGYYNDTQNRNTPGTPILKQEHLNQKHWSNDWASGCALLGNEHALIMVKESHKCVNQSGIDSGTFEQDGNQIRLTGWGIPTQEVSAHTPQKSWATWYITADNNESAIASAVRRFDRCRYPCNLETDAYIIANTWGSGEIGDPRPEAPGNASRRAAHEDVVLQEIESCGDLGIDVLQIDDGWQSSDDTTYVPGERGWHPHPDCWPTGWNTAVQASKKHNVRLGLWAAAEEISYDELVSNWTLGDFRQYKLDFAHFNKHEELHAVIDRCRSFITLTNFQCRVNWDVTENLPRFGYYYGRELGAIYLANRKPEKPVSTVYEPWHMLSDVWEMAKFLPIKQFQITCQNPLHTNHSTEAHKHDISYGLAISCVGIPLCFHRTSLYTEEQRNSVRDWLRGYQCHKHNLHLADCEPVGEKPNNKSWTGFHYALQAKNGYLMAFRELHDERPNHGLHVPALANSHLHFHDCHNGKQWEVQVDDSGFIPLAHKTAQASLLYYQKR